VPVMRLLDEVLLREMDSMSSSSLTVARVA
jgi:hypothetical protein